MQELVTEEELFIFVNFYGQTIVDKEFLHEKLQTIKTNFNLSTSAKLQTIISKIEVSHEQAFPIELSSPQPSLTTSFLFDAIKFFYQHRALLLILLALVLLPMVAAQGPSKRKEEDNSTDLKLNSSNITAIANPNFTFVTQENSWTHSTYSLPAKAVPAIKTENIASSADETSIEDCSNFLLNSFLIKSTSSSKRYEDCEKKLNNAKLTKAKHLIIRAIFNLERIAWPTTAETMVKGRLYTLPVTTSKKLDNLEAHISSILEDLALAANQQQDLNEIKSLMISNEIYKNALSDANKLLSFYLSLYYKQKNGISIVNEVVYPKYSIELLTDKILNIFKKLIATNYYEEKDLENYCQIIYEFNNDFNLECLQKLYDKNNKNEYTLAQLSGYYKKIEKNDQYGIFINQLLELEREAKCNNLDSYLLLSNYFREKIYNYENKLRNQYDFLSPTLRPLLKDLIHYGKMFKKIAKEQGFELPLKFKRVISDTEYLEDFFEKNWLRIHYYKLQEKLQENFYYIFPGLLALTIFVIKLLPYYHKRKLARIDK